MSYTLRIITFSMLLFFVSSLMAQTKVDPKISGNYTNLKFDRFARDVEEQTGYKFFYDQKSVDSVLVNLSFQSQPIETALNQIFANTDIHYAIDAEGNIFLVKGFEIQIQIPESSINTDSQSKFLSPLEDDKEEHSRLTIESKEFDIGRKTAVIGPGNATIAGYVKSYSNGESIIGASVYITNPLIGVSTNQFGYYALTIPKGKHELQIQSSGMKKTIRKVALYADGKLNVELLDDVIALKEIIVEADQDRNVAGNQMGIIRMDIKTMKKLPVVLGEVDILKSMLTLPGVQTVGEGTTGLNVRGGTTSQNLILIDDATIYNPSHLFGFFSAFNPDVIKGVELYKSSIPAEFGGRISSVLDVHTREGNKKKFSSSGGIGLVTSRLLFEGPILKDKISYLVGGRSTYSNWLLKKIPNDALRNSKASFYDLNARVDYEIDDKNNLYITGYASHDGFKFDSDTLYNYVSEALSLKWKHSFNNKLYGVLGGGYSSYDYKISSSKNPVEAFKLLYGIRQVNLKLDFNYFPVAKHTINFGITATRYSLSPGSKLKANADLKEGNDIIPDEQGLETAIYLGDQFELSNNISIYGGLRVSHYSFLGPSSVFKYRDGAELSASNIIDTVSYPPGKSIASYYGPEYRASVKYGLSGSSIKLSYNRTRQYIQILANTVAISPTDTWKLSDAHIKPQIGDQVSLGFYKNFRGNSIETSVETYYKSTQNAVDYKGGAQLLLNHHVETDIIQAKGKAYGVELMVRKMNGKLNGWVTYTYSRSLIKAKGQFDSEIINNGNYYPSGYDKPHAFNLVGNYKFSHRYSSSLNATYSTGRPITVPVGKYYLNGSYRTLYGPRNGDRVPEFFRVDFSLNIEGNHKIKKLAHGSWTAGVYNIFGRRNAYSIFYVNNNGKIQGYKLSVFGNAIPTLTYNFKF